MNQKFLTAMSTPLLRRYADALQDYIANRPDHINGLCSWLRRYTGEQQAYSVVEELVGECGYVVRLEGPQPERVEFARRVRGIIDTELKRRAQPKVKRTPQINLKKASLQRIFEFGLKHVRAQGRPAASGGTCRMRGPDGTKCVVGSMIDDTLAGLCDRSDAPSTPTMSNAKWFALIGRKEAKYLLLAHMQKAHDSASCEDEFMSSFEESMQAVASKFALTYKAPGTTLRA